MEKKEPEEDKVAPGGKSPAKVTTPPSSKSKCFEAACLAGTSRLERYEGKFSLINSFKLVQEFGLHIPKRCLLS